METSDKTLLDGLPMALQLLILLAIVLMFHLVCLKVVKKAIPSFLAYAQILWLIRRSKRKA